MLEINKVLRKEKHMERMRCLLVLLVFAAATLFCASTLYAVPTGGTATYMVAASNATDAVKARADYVCDGVADQVEIQAAIGALPSGEGDVYIVSGDYYFSAPIIVTKGYFTLRGSGYKTRFFPSQNIASFIQIAPAATITGLKISDLTLWGRSNEGFTVTDGIIAKGVAYPFNIHNIHFYLISGDALDFNGATLGLPITSPLISNSTFYELGGKGINASATNAAETVRVTGSLFSGIDNDAINTQGSRWSIVGNVFDNINRTGGDAIALVTGNDHVISGNEFTVAYRTAIRGQMQGVISGNSFCDASFGGSNVYSFIHLLVANVSITGNAFRGEQVPKAKYILWTYQSPSVIFSGNTINSTAYATGVFAPSGVAEPQSGILGDATGKIIHNIDYVTEKGGVASVANGGTIAHGLAGTPTEYNVTATVARRVVVVTAVNATNLTIGLRNDAGTAITTPEPVSWHAEYHP